VVFQKINSTATNLITYLNFISPPVSSERQVDPILSSASDIVSHPILLHRLCAHGLSDRYVNWFCSYLTNRQSSVRILDIFSLPVEFLSGVTQGSVLGTSLLDVFVNGLSNVSSLLNMYYLLMTLKYLCSKFR